MNIPVLGIFSSGRFIWEYLEQLKINNSRTSLNLNGKTLNLHNIMSKLENSLRDVYLDVVNPVTGEYKPGSKVQNPLFRNDKKISRW